MQASKIKIGENYAVKSDGPAGVALFRVTSVTTKRTGPHPSDFTHRVEGAIGNSRQTITVSNDSVLGPYTEYKELVEQKQAEEAAKKKAKQLSEDRAQELGRRLYALIGEPVPNQTNYASPFYISYNSVDIRADGVTKLLDALNALGVK